MTIKFIELFAGVGGFRYGLENVNRTQNGGSQEDTERASEDGGGLVATQGKGTSTENGRTDEHVDNQLDSGAFACVYSNEINQHANEIYRSNYGHEEARQDTRSITDVRADEIPDHDLLTAGFPCQSFSIAGQRGGFDDTRGTLFFDVARILREKRPEHFILENVKGLLSHDGGRTFNTIIGVLTDLGYRCEWEVVNSIYFGVPQNRERVFIVGHLGGECGGRVFPLERTDYEGYIKNEHGGIVKVIHNIYGGFKEKLVRVFGVLPTLRTPKGGGHIPTIVEVSEGNPISILLRWITPREAERGQGFPDDYTQWGNDDRFVLRMSNTQRYRAMGNAVSPVVIKAIGKKLLDVCFD